MSICTQSENEIWYKMATEYRRLQAECGELKRSGALPATFKCNSRLDILRPAVRAAKKSAGVAITPTSGRGQLSLVNDLISLIGIYTSNTPTLNLFTIDGSLAPRAYRSATWKEKLYTERSGLVFDDIAATGGWYLLYRIMSNNIDPGRLYISSEIGEQLIAEDVKFVRADGNAISTINTDGVLDRHIYHPANNKITTQGDIRKRMKVVDDRAGVNVFGHVQFIDFTSLDLNDVVDIKYSQDYYLLDRRGDVHTYDGTLITTDVVALSDIYPIGRDGKIMTEVISNKYSNRYPRYFWYQFHNSVTPLAYSVRGTNFIKISAYGQYLVGGERRTAYYSQIPPVISRVIRAVFGRTTNDVMLLTQDGRVHHMSKKKYLGIVPNIPLCSDLIQIGSRFGYVAAY